MSTLELEVGGMTCASCAARIERRLNRLDGVEATVNYATGTAVVVYDARRAASATVISTIEATGYTARLPESTQPTDEADPEPAEFSRRLRVCAALTLPVVALSMVMPLQFPGWSWVTLALAAPVVGWGARPFHRAAVRGARHGAATMDTLVSVGVLAATGWSVWALRAGSAEQPYLEVGAGVTTLILLGRHLEARARRRSGAALRALLALGAQEVSVLTDGGAELRVPIERLAVGVRFVVRPGEKVATDGIVDDGTSAVDTALLTGEAVPVEVGPGDEVTGGTVNTTGRLVVRATRVGSDTALAQIARLVTRAQSGKAPVQRLADRVSAVFVPAVIVLSLATLLFWLAAGDGAAKALTAAVAVLIIACPCALGLATPTALLVGTTRGAQLGILIKGPEVLESTRRVDTVVLDKTGTVTTGQMMLHDVVPGPGEDRATVLGVAGALEAGSEHPIGRAIAAAAALELGPPPTVTSFTAHAGLGASGRMPGPGALDALVGRRRLLADRAMRVPAELDAALTAAEAAGRTAVLVGWAGAVRGVLVVTDTIRPTSARAVAALRDLGLHPVLLTGDNERSAVAVAGAVGIDEVIAGVLPAGKVAALERLQAGGRVVAMVGDGVNDAAALAAADLGLAVGTGTDVAVEASDLTLVSGDLLAAADAVRLARRTLATIKGNLFWAFAYNVAAIPLAAAGLLNPLVAAAAMALSSVFVVSNSLRLRRFRPLPA